MWNKIMAADPVPYSRAIFGEFAARVSGLVQLMKPGISIYIGLTAWTSSLLRDASPSTVEQVLLIVSGFLMSAGAAAFNQAYEADLDVLMERTRTRPVPTGLISVSGAYISSAVFLAAGASVSYFFINLHTSLYLCLGAFSYIVLYTIAMKRRTALNVPVGGLCGVFASMAGSVTPSGNIGQAGIAMAGILYFWSAPHFWSLAIVKVDDYRKAGFPMLPVVKGNTFTSLAIVAHAVVLFVPPALFWPERKIAAGFALAAAVGFTGFCLVLVKKCAEGGDAKKAARSTFLFSLVYLVLIFTGIWIESAARS